MIKKKIKDLSQNYYQINFKFYVNLKGLIYLFISRKEDIYAFDYYIDYIDLIVT